MTGRIRLLTELDVGDGIPLAMAKVEGVHENLRKTDVPQFKRLRGVWQRATKGSQDSCEGFV